jgi:hypothetical protein
MQWKGTTTPCTLKDLSSAVSYTFGAIAPHTPGDGVALGVGTGGGDTQAGTSTGSVVPQKIRGSAQVKLPL